MKIVLDTNVLISGFITTAGVSREVLSLSLARHHVFISDYILEEFERILMQKIKIPKKKAKFACLFLKRHTACVAAPDDSEINFTDKKDVPILALLKFSKPDYFITGDKRLLHLKKIGKTLFLSPREALEVLQNT